MNSLPIVFAVNCVRVWTWLYTWRMPPASREMRRAEIESDLWESQSDATGGDGLGAALHILLRLLIGIPDDLGWRLEYAAAIGTLTQGSIAMSGRLAGAALVVGALWAIDADADRRRPAAAVRPSASALNQQIGGTMAIGDENLPHVSPRSLRFLVAGIVATVGGSMLPQLSAQSPQTAVGPAFETASIKSNRSGDLGWRLDPQPGGRLTGTNVPAAGLIRFAYELPDFQVAGGPKWLNSDRFDVVAKADGNPTLAQERLMLRRLLAERFKLTAHTEVSELPIYALVIARSDGKTGSQLRRSAADCAREDQPSSDSGVGPSPSQGLPRCGYFGFAPGTDLPAGRGRLAFRGLTMAALAKILVPMVHRSVSDQTGLSGYFDAEFDFMAELPPPPPPPGQPGAFTREPLVSVFTVFPEQLGLKLDSRRGRVDVLVIDRVERPTPE
jgi:uncharacterized protein (TIGR03435 family)